MKRPYLAVAFTFVFAVLSALVPVRSNAADVIKWKMPTAYPAGSYLWDFIAVNFVNKVKSLSNGQLIIEPFTAGSIGPALEVTESVMNKVAEAGHTWTNSVLREVDNVSVKCYQERAAKNAWFKKIYEDQVAFKAY